MEITVEQAAQETGYSAVHIRRLAASGKVKARRIGKRVLLIDVDSMAAYADEMRVLGSQKHARNG